MKKHLYRTLTIWAVLLIAIIYVYPTIGWMTLTPEERQARLDRWKEEDASVEKRGYWEDSFRMVRRWFEFDRDWVINLGLDLQGGVQMVIGIDYENYDPAAKQRYKDMGADDEFIIKDLQDQVKQRIERRTNEFGTKEPIIQTMGDRQIQIQLPGEQDVERAKKLILTTAYLTFNIVAGLEETTDVLTKIDAHFKGDFKPRLQRPGLNEGWLIQVPMDQIDKVREMVKEAEQVEGLIPDDLMIAFSRAPRPSEPQHYTLYVLRREAVMTGDGLQTAVARPNQQTGAGQWEIAFTLDAESGRKFGDRTEQNVNELMAIVVDGVVESAPRINERIGSSGVITGRFDPDEARDLAIALNSGSLPVPVIQEQTGIVGARLGEDSIRRGVLACLIGIAIVLVGITAYYHVLGFISCVALLFNALLILAAMAYLGATLTLPGIAGLILTLGMAVDANVLIYERMREEKRLGKSLLAVIDSGYSRAMNAIIDSNITTIISGVILLEYGSGPIQGFAATLVLGLLASLFTAIVVTRAIIDFLVAKKWLTKITMFEAIPEGTKIPFLKQRTWLTPITVGFMLIGLIYFGIRGNDNFGVEFTTGTNIVLNVDVDQPVNIADVRSRLSESGFEDPTVTAYDQDDVEAQNRYLIHVGDVESASVTGVEGEQRQDVADRVRTAIGPLAGGDTSKVVVEKVEMVGPTVGAQLKWDALQAIFFSTIAMIIYLWFRFELKFSIGAIVAMLHDVGITVGIFALTGNKISLAVVAAILTIIGYSLNDTIVVFDRLRENLKMLRGRGLTLLELMDKTINETLSRTILTGVLTLCVVLVLLFVGGDVIFDFALALTIGILVGTYSSIYVASPVVYWWQKYLVKRPHAAEGNSGGPSRRRRRSPRSTDTPDRETEVTA